MKRNSKKMTALMTKSFQSGMRVMSLLAVLMFGMAAQSQTFTHSVGKQATALNARGLQVVHEYRQVLYVKPGENVTLYRPDYATFRRYTRWFDYSTDAAATGLTMLTSGAVSTAKGQFYFDNASTLNARYTMPTDGKVHYIACEQSAYNDYTNTSSSIVEPTLSQRLIFEIHPAAEMAALVDAATGDNWLETYEMIAPTQNNLYIGPKYGFLDGATYKNYYCNAANPTLVTAGSSFTGGSTEDHEETAWTQTSQPASSATYVCTTAYYTTVSANKTATLSATNNTWQNGTKKDSQNNTWTIANWNTNSRTYTIVLPENREVTHVGLSLTNTYTGKGKGEQSYVVEINDVSKQKGTIGTGKNNTVSPSISGNYTNENLVINVSNAAYVRINSITITYQDMSGKVAVGTEQNTQPSASYRSNWEKREIRNGDFVEKQTKTDTYTTTSGFSWTIDGVAEKSPSMSSGQYFKVSSNSAGEHVYCLTYNSTNQTRTVKTEYTRTMRGTLTTVSTWDGSDWVAGAPTDTRTKVSETAGTPQVTTTGTAGQTYNIAKFTVNYHLKTEVGPRVDLAEGGRLNQSTLVTERRFNDAGTTWSSSYSTYLLSPVKPEESSYGFYWGATGRYHGTWDYSDRVVKDEYALVNNARELSWYYTGSGQYNSSSALKNHNYSGESTSLPGYFLFVDGSEKPGEVMCITTRANLCPGSKMFFSAYVADLSTKGYKAPNLDFIFIGVDAQGKDHVLTTYTTGEFGNNGKDNGDCGKWMRILFPFEFADDIDYVRYKLKITNKAAGGDGNDFAIDDIQIFVQNPPVMPIQASTVGCPHEGVSNTYAYLRVDYGALSSTASTFYYQWRNYQNNVIDTIAYLGRGRGARYGQITIAATPASNDIYANIADFDQYVQSATTPRATYGYIRENCTDEQGNTVQRYVLYIAQPMTLAVNYKYHGYVAATPEDLGPLNNCSASAELLVAAGITFKMGENVISSSETQTVCGSDPGTLQMVYRYVQRDLEGGILGIRELTDVKADWIFGDEAYINANPSIYFDATYAEIYEAIDNYRTGAATAAQTALFNSLVKSGLLTPNTSSIEPNMVGVSGAETVSYTAFPIISSVHVDDENIRCAEPSTFTFQLGDNGANSVSIFINTIESWETLPLYVKMNPRRIRVSANHLNDGDPSLTFNISLHGAQDQVYVCNSAALVSSTDPDAASCFTDGKIGLTFAGGADAETIDSLTNAVSITGVSRLRGGYDYTFRFTKTRGAGYMPDVDCNEFNTFITIRVVPSVVTWEGLNGDSWNNDGNWDTYVPMADTKVILRDGDYIIPNNVSAWGETQRNDEYESGATSYITYDINYRTFECGDIYVPAGATLVNQHRLTINGIVYYDLPTNAAKWTMCSFPIKGVVSGDMYIPTNENTDKTGNPFHVASLGQTTGQDATGRTTNKVYVSLYNAKDTVYGPSARTVEGTTWTTETNNLNISFSNPGYAVSIGADYTEDKVIRLPKPETEYKYYQYGAWVDQYATAIERPADYGKPAYQPTGVDGANGMNITVNNNTASDLFLIGNPTLAALDIEKFIEGNDNLAGAYYVSNMSSLGARKGSIISVVNDRPSVPGDYHILPVGGAALFQAKTSATSLTVNITPDMLVTSTGNTAATAAPRRVQAAPAADEMDDHSIYISARYNPVTSATCFTSYAVLSQGEEASDDVVDGEDAKTVMYDANKMRFAMYTIGGGKGLSVNQTSVDNDIVPLAVYSHTSMKTLYFVFQGNNDYLQEWDLVNLSDNSRTPLYDSIYVAIKTTANNGVLPLDGSVGYVLEHTRKTPSIATDIDETNPASAFGVYGTTGTLFAYSNDDMQDFCIYDASGRVVVAEKNAGRTAQYHLPTGVYMVRANGEIQKAIVK